MRPNTISGQLRQLASSRKYDVVVLGGSLVEQIMDLDELPKPRQSNVAFHNMEILPGGSGANTAVFLSRLGRSTLFFDRWGDDCYGDFLEQGLAAENLDVSLCLRTPGAPTQFMVILTLPNHDWSGIIRTPQELLLVEEDVKRVPWRDCSLFHIHGFSFKTAEATAAIRKAIGEARNHNLVVSIDASTPLAETVPELMAEFFRLADIVFANTHEARLLTGAEEPQAMIRKLMEGTPKLAVLKMGEKGSLIYDRERLEKIAPYPVDIVDTIGAGDVLVAGTLCGLLEGMTLAQAVDLGSRTASLVIGGMGAQSRRFDRSDVDSLL